MENLEKLHVIFHVEVKRHGRRTYVNISDTEAKAIGMEAGDFLQIQIRGIRRKKQPEA